MLRRWAILGGVLISLCAGCASSQPPSPSGLKDRGGPQAQSGGEQTNSAVEQRGTDTAPMVVKIPRTPEDEADKTDEAQRENERATRERIDEIFTGILMAATVVLAFFTVMLWRSTKEAVKDANAGIQIASKTLEHAKDAAQIELRPYIAPGVATLHTDPGGGGKCSLESNSRTSGKRPLPI